MRHFTYLIIYVYNNDGCHPNGTWNNEVGYGMVDAYAAVQKAMNHRNDLYIRDTVTDNGTTPSSVKYAHNSPDIWTIDMDGNPCNPTGGGIRTDGRYFQAVAHDDMSVLWGETATLYADDILETAEYKWYDEQGNEVGNGSKVTGETLVNTSSLAAGSYTVRLVSSGGNIYDSKTLTIQ